MQFARKRFLHERLLYLPKRLRNSCLIWIQSLGKNLAKTLPAEACKSSTAIVLPHERFYTMHGHYSDVVERAV